jgi:hypothetical protein
VTLTPDEALTALNALALVELEWGELKDEEMALKVRLIQFLDDDPRAAKLLGGDLE